MNSPTSTMPTPKPHTWTGPNTFNRLKFWCPEPWPITTFSTLISFSRLIRIQFVYAFARTEQCLLAVAGIGAIEIPYQPDEDRDRNDPCDPARNCPHMPCLRYS